jgi:hypothetical protein
MKNIKLTLVQENSKMFFIVESDDRTLLDYLAQNEVKFTFDFGKDDKGKSNINYSTLKYIESVGDKIKVEVLA